MKNILIITTLLLVIASCRKEHYYPLNPTIREMATMKPGSYMVFEDSLHPGVTDSFWVENYYNEVVKNDNDRKNIISSDVLVTSFKGLLASLRISCGGSESQIATVGYAYISNDNYLYGGIFLATWPVTNNYTTDNSFKRSTQKEFYETWIWNNDTFKNVYYTEGIYGSKISHCHFNQEKGIIRLDVQNDTLHRVWMQTNSLILK